MQTKDLHCDQDDRRVLAARRTCVIRRHLAISDLDLGVACGEPGGVGVDGIRPHRSRGKSVARGDGRRCREEETSSRKRVNLARKSYDIGCHFHLYVHELPP
jgi:hypothetical protein